MYLKEREDGGRKMICWFIDNHPEIIKTIISSPLSDMYIQFLYDFGYTYYCLTKNERAYANYLRKVAVELLSNI